MILRLFRLSLLVVVLAFPSNGFAHRLDEYLEATIVGIEPDGVQLRINLTPGVEVVEQILKLIDADADEVISAHEAAAYAENLKQDLVVKLDGRDVEVELTASNVPSPAELRSGWGIIQLEFSVATEILAAGAHDVTVENQHLPTLAVFLFNAARPKSDFIKINRQIRNKNQSTGQIEFTFDPPSPSTSVAGTFAFLSVLILLIGTLWWRRRAVGARRT